MRPTYAFHIFICFAFFVMQSCSKESQKDMVLSPSSVNVITASVSANSKYELKLDKYETVAISKQAVHFLESSTGRDSKSGLLIYKYVPDSKFRGEDEVILSNTKSITSYSSGSCSRSNNLQRTSTVTNYITIKFKITN